MPDIAELGFRVDSRGILLGTQNLDKLDKAGDRVGKTSVRTGGLIDRSMREASGGIAFASQASIGLTNVMSKLGPLVGGIGFLAAAGNASRYASSIAEVSTLVDTATFDMDKLSAAALKQAGDFGSMPIPTVKAYYQAISAGADTAEKATDALTASNKLAIGGVTDVTTAVDGLTSVMNAYGGEAGSFTDISDSMFVAMRAGKTTIGELSGSIGQLAPIAAQAGASFDEVMAATAALTKGGVSTSVAMNGLRAIMAAVIKPTSEATKLASKLGIEFNAAGLQSKGFAGFMDEVREKTGGSTEQMGLLFGGVEALTPALALTGKAAGDFAATLEQMADKAGASEEAFKKVFETAGVQGKRIVAGLNSEFLKLGGSLSSALVPVLTLVADNITLIGPAATIAAAALTGKLVTAGIAVVAQQVQMIASERTLAIAVAEGGVARAQSAQAAEVAERKKALAISLTAKAEAAATAVALRAAQADLVAVKNSGAVAAAQIREAQSAELAAAAQVAASRAAETASAAKVKAATASQTMATAAAAAARGANSIATAETNLTRALNVTTAAKAAAARASATTTAAVQAAAVATERSATTMAAASASAKAYSGALGQVKLAAAAAAGAESAAAAARSKAATATASVTAAAVASAAAQKSVAVVSTQMGIAARAGAAGMRLLSGAMALVGGPVGAIVLAATAMYSFREEIAAAIRPTNAAKSATEVYADSLETINRLSGEYVDASDDRKEVLIEEAKGALAAAESQLALAKAHAEMIRVQSQSGSIRDTGKTTADEVSYATAAYESQIKTVESLRDEIENFGKSSEITAVATKTLAKAVTESRDEFGRTAEEAKSARDAYDDMTTALELQLVGYNQGEEAMRRRELALKNMIPAQIESVVTTEREVEAAKQAAEAREEHTKALAVAQSEYGSLQQAQAIQNAELTEGAEAARRLELSYKDGYTPALIESTVETEKAMRAQQAFSDALGQVFDAVLDGKNPLKEMENIGKAWLRDMISTFATNKITAYFTGQGAGGVSGMFDTVLGSMKNMFSGGSNSSGMFSNALGRLGAMFTGNTAAVGATSSAYSASTIAAFNASQATGAATTGLAGLGSSIAAAAGPIALMTAGVFAIGKSLSSTTRQVAAGFEFSYRAGNLLANSVEEWEKKGGLFRSSKSWDILGPMEKGLNDQIDQYFTSLNRSVVDGVKLLGVTGADEILSGFEVAITRITGENQSQQLSDALAGVTTDAYAYAFTQISPELQTIIGDGLAVIEKPMMDAAGNMELIAGRWEEGEYVLSAADAEHNRRVKAAVETYASATAEWEQNSQNLGEAMLAAIEKVQAMNPALTAMGLAASMTNEQMVAASIGIVDAFGNMEEATAFMSLIIRELYTEAEIASNNLGASREYLAGFNEELGLSGAAMIDTRTEARAYIETLIDKKAALVASGVATEEEIAAIDAQIVASGNLAVAVGAVEDEQIRQIASTNALAEAGQMLGFEFDALAPSAYLASDAIIEMAGGMDEFKTKTGLLYDLLYTKQQQQDIALAQAAVSLDGYNQLLGLSGDQSIQTAADLQLYMDGLDQSSPLYQSQLAILLNMSPALTAVNESGQSTTDILNNLDPALASVAGAGAETTAALDGATEGLGNLQQVTGTTTTLIDAMNASVGLSGATAITSAEGLNNYIAGLEATGQTSSQAYLDAVALSGAMAGMSAEGLILNTVIDSLPVHLQEAYAAMDFAALGTSATALAAAGDVEGASTVIDSALAGVSDNLSFTTAEADTLNASLGLAGDAVITTTDQLQAHTSALDLNTVAGQTALAAIEGFVAGIDNATVNTDVTTDATLRYNEEVAALGATITTNTETTVAATERNAEFKTGLEVVIENTGLATGAIDAMAASAGALTESNVNLMATVDQLPTNTADAFELINQQGIATGETLTASAGVIDIATIAANDSLAGLSGSVTETGGVMTTQAGVIDGATAQANGALSAFGSAIQATAGAASSAASIAAGAAGSAGRAANDASNYAGNASSAASRAADAAGSAASAAYRASDAAGTAANAAYRASQSAPQSTGSYSTGIYRISEAERLVTVHKDEMIPNPEISNQLRAMGVTHNSIPDDFGGGQNTISATPIFSQPARNDNAELLAKIDRMVEEQGRTNAELAELKASARRRETAQNHIAGKSSEQVEVAKDGNRINERAGRKSLRQTG